LALIVIPKNAGQISDQPVKAGFASVAQMAKQNLTDRKLKTLKAAPEGQRLEIMDQVIAGFGVRVSDTGLRSFILKTRYPGSRHPTRRTLGEYPALSLEDARRKAADWRTLIKQGIDPTLAEQRQRETELRKQATTVMAVASDFFTEKLVGERKGEEAERMFRRELLPAWGSRPITEITDLDVVAIVKAKKSTAPAEARNLLALVKRFFTWTIDQRVYGLKTSPADGLRPSKLIGKKRRGDRILSDDEMFALWRAASRIGYPHGPVYQLLMLTALRLNEVADASRSEFDLPNRIWIIPGERMKGENEEARPHAVPLTQDIMAVLDRLPRFKGGDHLFSTSFGTSPVWMASKVKDRIDARMLRTLRALARRRGEDSTRATLAPWKNHDIRRTVRSQLSRLKVSEEAREAVLAHARPGIKGTYDLHDYFDEKREALEHWAARLRSIVEPPLPNVLPLRKIM
jgi:integrase